jgi:uncharacterized iron-regulated membrane protein
MSTAVQASRISPRVREFLRLAHIWTGLVLCLPLAVLGATGSILVYDTEFAAMFGGPSAPVRVAADGQQRTAEDIIKAAQLAVPPNARPTMLSLPVESGDPAVVRFQRPGAQQGPGGAQAIRIDPVSLEQITSGGEAMPSWMRVVHQLHGNFMYGRDGRDAVGWMGVVMLVLGFTGLVIWWPRPARWKAAFGVSRTAKGMMLHRELHGAVGIWGLVIFIVVSFSGVYITFPQTTGEIVQAAFPGRDVRSMLSGVRVQPVQGIQPITVNEAVGLAESAVDDARIRMIALPARPDQPMRINMIRDGYADGAPMITMFIDPWKREVIETLDPRNFTVGETIMAWQRPLHAGAGLGGVYRFLVFLSGLMPVAFAITGIAMWLYKQRAKRRRTNAARAAAE